MDWAYAQYSRGSPLSRYGSERNAGVAGAIVADVSPSPGRSGVMLTPPKNKHSKLTREQVDYLYHTRCYDRNEILAQLTGHRPDRLIYGSSLSYPAPIIAQASSDEGLTYAPVFVSTRRKLRRARSIPDHGRPGTLPRHHPIAMQPWPRPSTPACTGLSALMFASRPWRALRPRRQPSRCRCSWCSGTGGRRKRRKARAFVVAVLSRAEACLRSVA